MCSYMLITLMPQNGALSSTPLQPSRSTCLQPSQLEDSGISILENDVSLTPNANVLPSPEQESSINSQLRHEDSGVTVPLASDVSTDISTPSVSLTASTDAAWNKRGTVKAYNSLSGFSSLLGYRSGKVLAYSVRTKRCVKCEKGHPSSDHDCRKNWDKSAKAMESDVAIEMITKNDTLKESNCIIGAVIGDDDSSMIAGVRRESCHQVEKWSDIAHAKNTLSNALWALKLPEPAMGYLKKCFSYALEQHKGNAASLESAILNIPEHSFGNHEKCREVGSWCKYGDDPTNYKHNRLPGGKPLAGLDLKCSLMKIFDKFARNSKKLAPCGSTQANESFNNLVASKHPKSKYYAGSAALHYRVASAVSQKNLGTTYVVKVHKKLGLSLGENTTKFRTKKDLYRNSRATTQKDKSFKARRLFLKKARSRKTAASEKREGISYESACGLEGIAELVDDPDVPQNVPETKDLYMLSLILKQMG